MFAYDLCIGLLQVPLHRPSFDTGMRGDRARMNSPPLQNSNAYTLAVIAM